ncbi:hypothetical protein DDT91_05255 [Algoriphagus sp. AK58]|nr:hypothetical protein [Algoriphagus sp. AK58]
MSSLTDYPFKFSFSICLKYQILCHPSKKFPINGWKERMKRLLPEKSENSVASVSVLTHGTFI